MRYNVGMSNTFKEFWKGGNTYYFKATIRSGSFSVTRNFQLVASSEQEAMADAKDAMDRDFANRENVTIHIGLVKVDKH
jgi:hypothetical protein